MLGGASDSASETSGKAAGNSSSVISPEMNRPIANLAIASILPRPENEVALTIVGLKTGQAFGIQGSSDLRQWTTPQSFTPLLTSYTANLKQGRDWQFFRVVNLDLAYPPPELLAGGLLELSSTGGVQRLEFQSPTNLISANLGLQYAWSVSARTISISHGGNLFQSITLNFPDSQFSSTFFNFITMKSTNFTGTFELFNTVPAALEFAPPTVAEFASPNSQYQVTLDNQPQRILRFPTSTQFSFSDGRTGTFSAYLVGDVWTVTPGSDEWATTDWGKSGGGYIHEKRTVPMAVFGVFTRSP